MCTTHEARSKRKTRYVLPPTNNQKSIKQNRFIQKTVLEDIFQMIFLIFLLFTSPAIADEIPKLKFIECVIGEAEDQGIDGMKSICHALRNRGTTKGVYGCTSNRVKKHLYSSDTFIKATRAYEESKLEQDTIGGANSWYSVEDVKKDPSIFKRCTFTGKLKDHFFFKCE